MAFPLASVIILNYNGKDCLINCLTSVLSNNYSNYEVLLVDNSSADSSLKMAEAKFGKDPRLKIIKNKKNLGYSGGNNVGFLHSRGEYVVFLNNDTIVDPNWLSALVGAMENDSTIGLAQSLILTIEGDKIQNAGWLFNDYLVNKYQLCNNMSSDLKLESTFEISFPCGASMMIKRPVFEGIGLFDPAIPFFYDDTLLALKTWLAKKRVVTVAESKVRHIGGATKVWNIKFTTYHLLKSNICLLFDSYPRLADLARAWLVTAFNLTTNSLFCLKNRNVDAIFGSLQALAWAVKNFRYVWQNKLNHWSKAGVSPQTFASQFMRIGLPVQFYLFPSKLCSSCHALEIQRYERKVINKQPS